MENNQNLLVCLCQTVIFSIVISFEINTIFRFFGFFFVWVFFFQNAIKNEIRRVLSEMHAAC